MNGTILQNKHRPISIFKTSPQKTVFDDLPEEVVLTIFQLLTLKELQICRLVSKRWNCIADDKLLGLWTSFCVNKRSPKRRRIIPFEVVAHIFSKGGHTVDVRKSQISDPVSWDVLPEGSLRYLTLRKAVISPECLGHLIRSNQGLQQIRLKDVPVNADICGAIAKLPDLQELTLRNYNNLSIDELKILKPAFGRCKSLHLRGVPLQEDQLDTMMMSVHPDLESLSLSTELWAIRVKHLVKILFTCPNLEIIFYEVNGELEDLGWLDKSVEHKYSHLIKELHFEERQAALKTKRARKLRNRLELGVLGRLRLSVCSLLTRRKTN